MVWEATLVKHTDREYENELARLREQVLLMGATVEQLLESAMGALQRRDVDLAQRTIENDDPVDRLEMEIDRLCLRLLALRQPVASDLRFITMVLKVVTDLERSGDLAVNVCERVIEMGDVPTMPTHDSICRMGSLAQAMLRDALDAFVNRDALKAQAVMERDNAVDAMYEQLFPELGAVVRADPESVEMATRLQSIGKYVERIADHATNISEMVVFMVRGQDVRHHSEVALAGSKSR
jgi:phosphate transport system protein